MPTYTPDWNELVTLFQQAASKHVLMRLQESDGDVLMYTVEDIEVQQAGCGQCGQHYGSLFFCGRAWEIPAETSEQFDAHRKPDYPALECREDWDTVVGGRPIMTFAHHVNLCQAGNHGCPLRPVDPPAQEFSPLLKLNASECERGTYWHYFLELDDIRRQIVDAC